MTEENENDLAWISGDDLVQPNNNTYSISASVDTSLAKLCVKSRISHDHEDNDLLKDMIVECYGESDTNKIVTELIDYEELGMKLYEHTISFYDQKHYVDFLKRIYEHLVFPIGPYENIKYGDFEVVFLKGDIGCYTSYMAKKTEMLEEQMMVDKHIMDSLNSNIQKLEKEVESITTFFNNMGLARYKPTIQAILGVLDDNGMVNKDHMESQIFTEIH